MEPILKTIPEQVDAEIIPEKIAIYVDSKIATVAYNQMGTMFYGDIHIPTMIAAATPEDQEVIKTFFKQLLAQAVGVATSSVPDMLAEEAV